MTQLLRWRCWCREWKDGAAVAREAEHLKPEPLICPNCEEPIEPVPKDETEAA